MMPVDAAPPRPFQRLCSIRKGDAVRIFQACLVLGLGSGIGYSNTPAPAAGPDPGVFAIGSSTLGTRMHPKWIPQMSAIGIRDWRACRTSWNMVQPVGENEWSWTELDRQLDYLESRNIRTGGLFSGTASAWNKLDHERGLPLHRLDAWSRHVYEMVKHAKGRIKYWETWNEPPNGTRNAPASDYAKLVMATYKAAKEADPDCQIGLAAKSAHINYLEQAIQAGAKDHFDYITLHPYEVLGCVVAHPGTEAVYMGIIPTLRKMLAEQNPAKADVPVFFTELGYDSRKGEDKQAQALVKAYAMGIAQGITSIHWYEGIDGDSGPLGLLRKDASPRPAYKAMAEMIRLLGQNPVYHGWILLNEKHYGFVFQGSNGTVLATWTSSGKPDRIDFGQPVQLVDPATGVVTRAGSHELTLAPVLIDGVPPALVEQAKANKNKPFPWGGDYSNVRSVSITMGAQNIEKGLHSQSAESIAADVVAYGGNSRSGDIPGGNVFMVDPNFLSYTKTPIEISIVVRRNEAGEPARLELEYESTSGYKKAAIYQIPDNKQWHTATWRLDDTQFVGTWAFNFRLNSGKYLVQSVTVTKLNP